MTMAYANKQPPLGSPLKRMMTVIQYHFQEWVRREIIDFDPYDDEAEEALPPEP